jgi:hypothetical protein
MSTTVADQHFGGFSQLQVELRCKLADVEREAATWHREEYREWLSTYVGERATRLLFGESQFVQSASSDTASADQQQQEQHERCVRHLIPVPVAMYSWFLSLTILPCLFIAATQSKRGPFNTNFNFKCSFFVRCCTRNR